MPITNKKDWEKAIVNNKDEYGKACIDTAKGVMELLDKEKDFDCHDLICRVDKEVKAGGLTGFMAGAVASMVSSFHSRGKEFKEKWNKDWGVKNSKGVVNPAIATIKSK